MVEEQPPQPKRTLGDYAMQQGLRHFSSIAIPTITKDLEMKHAFLNLISTHHFNTMDHEDPYTHLFTLYELVGTIGSIYVSLSGSRALSSLNELALRGEV